jgi:NlpC/P60 family
VALSGSAIVAEVEKFAHFPYVYGAAGPSSFDCSGLVQYVLKTLGVTGVPRTSEEQWAWVQKVSKSELQPGDLVFAQFPGDNASPGHVGVYTGNGQVLSAEDPALGVGYSSLASWGSAVVGYGRVPGASASGAAGTGASSSGVGGLLGIPASIVGTFTDADKALGGLWTVLTALLSPSTYIRAAAGVAGAILLAFGAWFLIKAAA